MHLDVRHVPPPAALAVSALLLFLAAIAVVGQTSEADPFAADAAPVVKRHEAGRDRDERRRRAPAPPPARSQWSGHAFDACRAPSQRVMDRWRTASPFTGVGIYLGGIHRACEQQHLTPRWVARQTRAGWQLLPIWVGPQASCTGFDHRITSRPGPHDAYGAARVEGTREARRAAAAARALGIRRGEVLFYDLEGFSTHELRCRRSSLTFLEAWTHQVHRAGYRSGVYSHVNSGISLISRTGPGYVRPDAVWYAWIDRVGGMPGEYVADPAFMRTSRVHQYVLDDAVEFGGIEMDIDWNFVNLGAARRPSRPASCETVVARTRPAQLTAGARGPAVRAAQCLVSGGQLHPTKATGRYDAGTVKDVRRFQARRGLRTTGVLDRRTWTSLLARGREPFLKPGAEGEPVVRLQRSLNAALAPQKERKLAVDGSLGKETVRAVARYRRHLGLRGKEVVVTERVWHALRRGTLLPRRQLAASRHR